MKIAILGTKGIPNNYGGFEQFAEYLSIGLVQRGHDVTVYNPSYHPFKESMYNGVRIVTIFSPENFIGSSANFIYDHLCLKQALKQKFDIIYEAGYHSVALSFWILGVRNKKRPVVITNMDGLEWKRSKWGFFTRQFIKYLEKKAVENSPYLISDNIGIQQYYMNNFNRESFFIPYGANRIDKFEQDVLSQYELQADAYNLIVARLEPENNIKMVLDAYLQSKDKRELIIIGNHETRYGRLLKKKYQNSIFRFVGGIYNKTHLDAIRHFSFLYFHGHSVGGTNPSLLEAMACQCFIVAHNNPFNLNVLDRDALYFSDDNQLAEIINQASNSRAINYENFISSNTDKIGKKYQWEIIAEQHEALFKILV